MQQVKTRRRWYQGQPPVKAILILPSNVFVLQETKKGDDLATLGLCFDAKDVFELGLDRAKNHHKRKSIFQQLPILEAVLVYEQLLATFPTTKSATMDEKFDDCAALLSQIDVLERDCLQVQFFLKQKAVAVASFLGKDLNGELSASALLEFCPLRQPPLTGNISMQQVKTRRRWYQGQPPVKAILILPSNVFVLQETKKGDDLATLGLCFDAKDVFELGLDRAKNHHKRKSIFQQLPILEAVLVYEQLLATFPTTKSATMDEKFDDCAALLSQIDVLERVSAYENTLETVETLDVAHAKFEDILTRL
ncbi:hypothetical protein E3N88_32939 [Mikania micrantha]|uniref:Uncharacterized protein n=1 Tax=Mikania micrantha TaxID=192012 RepID=A0A5N6M9U7_9ASTR|nr:hypothetical protein E3N88_32939 [Mikania micrantha]